MSKYPPKTSVLRAFASGRVGWTTATAEWIDNAFDRRASRVAITFEKDGLTIQDDGEGTPSPQAIVQLGEHTHAADGLGEYGIGGTESLLWAGGERSDVVITTTHRGVTRRLAMNWLDYARSDWELPDVHERPAEPGEIGTKIHLRTLQARPPRDLNLLCSELGFLYSRAIRRENKQITIKAGGVKERPRIVTPWQPPEFDAALPQVRDAQIQIGTKEAVVNCGVVKEGVHNPKNGITYWFRYRVILPASAKGCGDHLFTRVCGFVELLDGWKASLTRNKNGLVVGDDLLFDEVERLIKPVLIAAEQVGSTFALRDLSHRLESRIAPALKGRTSRQPDAKARRAQGDRHGTVTPKDTDRKHSRADHEQAGVRFPGTSGSRGLNIGYDHLGGIKTGEAKPPSIILNLDNPFIADAVHRSDETALVMAVSSLIADWDCSQPDEKGNRYLRTLEPKTFAEQLGSILAAAPSLDGRPAIRLASPTTQGSVAS